MKWRENEGEKCEQIGDEGMANNEMKITERRGEKAGKNRRDEIEGYEMKENNENGMNENEISEEWSGIKMKCENEMKMKVSKARAKAAINGMSAIISE